MPKQISRNSNLTRPSKSEAERRRRLKVHRRRLIDLGVPPELVEKMQADEMRALLRHPKRTARRFAGTAAAPAAVAPASESGG